MIKLVLLFQQLNIEEKIINSPNDSYQLGVVIGSYLPLVILVGFAYWMHYRAKKRSEKE